MWEDLLDILRHRTARLARFCLRCQYRYLFHQTTRCHAAIYTDPTYLPPLGLLDQIYHAAQDLCVYKTPNMYVSNWFNRNPDIDQHQDRHQRLACVLHDLHTLP